MEKINNGDDKYVEDKQYERKQMTFKGSDRQCIVVELRMQYCEDIFKHSFETYETFPSKVDVQNHTFGELRFENRFLKIIK